MTEAVEFRDSLFSWPKGATFWGEALPYVRTEAGGKRFLVYGDWWTQARIELLTLWLLQAAHSLRIVLGHDKHQGIRARGKEAVADFCEQGKVPQVTELVAWVPSPLQALRIDEHVAEYARTREWVRASLRTALDRLPDLRDDLPGEPDDWTGDQMSAAVLRMPKMLMTLVRLGEIPDPGTIVPEKALVQ